MNRIFALAILWLLFSAGVQAASPWPSGCIQPIAAGQTINATLTTNSCYLYYGNDTDNLFYTDVYAFNGTAGQQIAIAMDSTDVDAWLDLYDVNDLSVASLMNDDNGGGGTNARIPSGSGYYTLPATGTYYILANTALSNQTGAYTISLTATPGTEGPIAWPASCIQPIAIGQTINGTLTTNSCYLYYGTDTSNLFYTDVYSFDGTAGQQIAIAMSSTTVDAWLAFLSVNDLSVPSLISDDNGGGGTNARIPAGSGYYTLPATGTYYISAMTALSNQIGAYTLSLTAAPAAPGPTAWPASCIQPIAIGQTINATLTTNSCYVYYGTDTVNLFYTDVYAFNATAGEQIAITMNSAAVDAWLALYNVNDVSVPSLQSDNNGGGGTNARIPAGSGYFTLPATGTYYIWANTAFSNQVGPYSIALTGAGSPPLIAPLNAAIKSEETQTKIDFQPFPFMIRAQADANVSEVSQLVALGPAAVDAVLDEFRRPPTLTDDVGLSLLAYALEKIGDKRAIPVLAAWLDQNMFTGLSGWTTDFVTHTIKVLQGQSGINTSTFTYLIDEKFDALLEATRSAQAMRAKSANGKVGVLAQALGSGAANKVNAKLTPQQQNNCDKKILVTGINAAGQEVTLDLPYKTVIQDINERLRDPSVSQTEKDAAARRVIGWAGADGQIFGGSDYQVAADSQITDAANCAGTVIEKVVNQLNAMLGVPINLGRGQSNADAITKVAKEFGTEVSFSEIDTLTVIAIGTGDSVGHVEVPISVTGTNAVIQSKFDYGERRLHSVDLTGSVNEAFRPVVFHLGGQPYFLANSGVDTKFYKIDPSRIRRIVVDSSRCICTPGDPANIAVQISQPTGDETSSRVVTIEGSAGSGGADLLSGATLLVNNVAQNISIANGAFQAQVVLRSGDNVIKVSVEGVDGRRGCAVKNIKSTTPQTTISATLTWNLGEADVDLYVTQPDNQTAWYRNTTTLSGGRLDVDNTSGFGPENYFISLAADSALRTGTYAVRVHYYADHREDEEHPVRPVNWRVVILLNEGTPDEKIEFYTGTLSKDNPGNDSPGSSGPDWATAREVTLPPAAAP